jgi:hypothetical protein
MEACSVTLQQAAATVATALGGGSDVHNDCSISGQGQD